MLLHLGVRIDCDFRLLGNVMPFILSSTAQKSVSVELYSGVTAGFLPVTYPDFLLSSKLNHVYSPNRKRLWRSKPKDEVETKAKSNSKIQQFKSVINEAFLLLFSLIFLLLDLSSSQVALNNWVSV
jgi:hypothetical protein